MSENLYVLEDIEQFIIDYKNKNCVEPNELIANIPIIGKVASEKFAMKKQRISFFEMEYMKAKEGSAGEQARFIIKMTPILDEFYDNQDNKKNEDESAKIKKKI